MLGAAASGAQTRTVHISPLNRDPAVQEAFAHFYALDYDPALQQFQRIADAHPNDPLAADYVLDAVLFHQLYNLDLLDTTLYAHDGFLTGKHRVAEDPALTARINQLSDKAIALADARLRTNPNDVDALYARAWSKSLRAVYMGLVERSYVPALRMALGARSDDDQVLRLDPAYVDAELVVGIHQYVVGSLPFPFKIMAGLAGIHGSKEKGIAMLRDCGRYGVTTSVQGRTALALFLRREAKYDEAERVVESLRQQYPHNFLFWLEAANLQKDAGHAAQAVALYRALLQQARQPGYFPNAHLELAWFGLGDTLRGQNDAADAAEAFMQGLKQPTASLELKRRGALGAGMEYDVLGRRAEAQAAYRQVLAMGDSDQASLAARYLKEPYRG
jgi:tetratricopeptide (TPR) repeat protein